MLQSVFCQHRRQQLFGKISQKGGITISLLLTVDQTAVKGWQVNEDDGSDLAKLLFQGFHGKHDLFTEEAACIR